MWEEKKAKAVEGRGGGVKGEGGGNARNFTPISVFHMRINTTQDRIGMNWTRVYKNFTILTS